MVWFSYRSYSFFVEYIKHNNSLHSALNVLMERKDYKPVENETTVEMLKYFKTIPNISVSFIQ